jgi:hypothetical protein
LNLPETALNFWPDGGEVMTAPAQLELYCTLVSFSRRNPSTRLRGLEFRMPDDLRATLWARPRGTARMLVVKRTVLSKRESFMAGSWNLRMAPLLLQKTVELMLPMASNY